MKNQILSELDSILVAAELFIKEYYRVRKKLEGVYSPTSPQKGTKKATEEEILLFKHNRFKFLAKKCKN